MNESETKRGKSYRLLCFLFSSLSLEWGCRSVPITTALLRHSCSAHMGWTNELEDPITERTHRRPQRHCCMHNTPIKVRGRSSSIIFWPEVMLWLTNWSPLTSQPTHWCCSQLCLKGAPRNFSRNLKINFNRLFLNCVISYIPKHESHSKKKNLVDTYHLLN